MLPLRVAPASAALAPAPAPASASASASAAAATSRSRLLRTSLPAADWLCSRRSQSLRAAVARSSRRPRSRAWAVSLASCACCW
jgi:hypothetical protein